MAYRRKFEGATKEEVLQKAESFKASLSYVEQPSIESIYEEEGRWIAVVLHYGTD